MDARVPTVRAVTHSVAIPIVGPPHAEGHVRSVHRSAVNVAFEGGLVTIAGAATGGLPGGILVPDGFDPAALRLRAGMRVRATPARLGFADAVVIDLATSRPWSPRLRPAGPLPSDLAARARQTRAVLAGLGREGLGDGFGGLLAGAGADRLAALRQAIATGDAGAIAAAGEALVGLGAGLTPSGDDVLVGLDATLAAGGHTAAAFLATTWARRAAGRTTEVAVDYHRHAANGDFAERLHVLLGAILGGPRDAIEPAVRAAAAVGATSGVDALHGVALGLDLLSAAAAQRRAA